MPEIKVHSISLVTVDGEPVGTVMDLLDNRPHLDGIKSLAFASLQAWVDARDQAHAGELAAATKAALDAVEAAKAECAAHHSAECDKIHCDHTETLTGFQALVEKLHTEIAQLKTQIEALGGTELGRQMAKEAAIRAAQEAFAKAQADLAAASQ